MQNIAIITARGGSKRIPKKNIKLFCGKPIIVYSIEAAIKSGVFDTIMVSTDSEEIADIASKNGALVPFMRNPETSNDYATTKDVLLEVLSKYNEKGKLFDIMACIYPTAPFVSGNRLVDAYNMFIQNKALKLTPVVRFSYPPQRAYIIKENELQFKWENYRLSRSQDLEPFYHDAGQFYFYDVKEFIKTNGIIREKNIPMILPETEVQDIDNNEDWVIAELKYKMMSEKENSNETI